MSKDISIQLLGQNIAYLRKQNNLTQTEMAKLLCIGIGSLRRIEHGELPPRIRISFLYSVYDSFGILPGTLLRDHLGENT